MIQLNLLPDIKLDYIKAQRSHRLVISIAGVTTIAAVVLLGILLSVSGLQKKHLNDLSKDINSQSTKLSKETDIGKILTVQNQLESLTTLHSGKPAASRLFDYLNQVTPANLDISSFTTDFTLQTASITGSADTISNVNKYVDTLKFTTYDSDSGTKKTPAFSNVVLSSFALTSGQQQAVNHPANYTITLSYDVNIFDITQKIKLTVPSLVTTRSQLEQPGDLFQAAPTTTAAPATTAGSH